MIVTGHPSLPTFGERETMALKDIIIETQTDLLANPDHAIATFSVDSRQTDTGPNPVEAVLAALATCQEITYRAYATTLGIPLESVSVTLEGSLDLRGFFAVKTVYALASMMCGASLI
jgi:hypothetical protein